MIVELGGVRLGPDELGFATATGGLRVQLKTDSQGEVALRGVDPNAATSTAVALLVAPEEAVSVAASFAAGVRAQDSLLDLMVVGPEAYVFTAGRGVGHLERMLEILADVRPCVDRPFSTLHRLVAELPAPGTAHLGVRGLALPTREGALHLAEHAQAPPEGGQLEAELEPRVESRAEGVRVEAGPDEQAEHEGHALGLGGRRGGGRLLGAGEREERQREQHRGLPPQ